VNTTVTNSTEVLNPQTIIVAVSPVPPVSKPNNTNVILYPKPANTTYIADPKPVNATVIIDPKPVNTTVIVDPIMEAKPVNNDPIEILPKPFPSAETNQTEIIDDINVEVEKDSVDNNLVSLVNSP
jgi:hypothetical protein